MRIFLICSKDFFEQIPPIKSELELLGHEVILPDKASWEGPKLLHSAFVMQDGEAVLVLNFEKAGVPNYIGGGVFIEMSDAFRLGKKIFLYHHVPEGNLNEEVLAFQPVIIHGDLSKIT